MLNTITRVLQEQLGSLALNQSGEEEGRGKEGNVWCFFQTASANERVGMALDKLPDPLPLRHSKQ